MNLQFLKAQLILELEEDFPLEEILFLVSKIGKTTGYDFEMKNYHLSFRTDPRAEIFLTFFTDTKIFQFKYYADSFRSNDLDLKRISRTDFVVGRKQSILNIYGDQKFTLMSELPHSPKALMDFQKDLNRQIAK